MTDAVQIFDIGFRLTDSNNDIVGTGGTIEIFEAGTTTPKPVYSDQNLSVSIGPVVDVNSSGQPVSGGGAPVLLYTGPASYKIVCKDATGAIIPGLSFDGIKGAVTIPTTSETALPSTPMVSRTSSYSVLTTDQGKWVNANPTSASFAVTLPSAVTAGDGWAIGIRHTGTANVVAIRTTASETVLFSGQTKSALSLTGKGQSVWMVSDGANWHVTTETNAFMLGNGVPTFRVADRLTAPPSSHTGGGRYLINGTPTGVWDTLGFSENDIAESDGNGSWFGYSPDEGWLAFIEDENFFAAYYGGAWHDYSNAEAPDASTMEVVDVFYDGSGTNAISSGTWTRFPEVTSLRNSVSGATVTEASATVTLPAGNYMAWLSSSVNLTTDNGNVRARLYSTTGSATILSSTNAYALNGGVANPTAFGFFTLAAEATLRPDVYVTTSSAVFGLTDVASGIGNYYGRLVILNLASLRGPTGAQGVQGTDGLDAAHPCQWSTATSGDPGSGKIRGNNSVFASITQVAVNKTDSAGGDLSDVLPTWDDSTSAAKGLLKVTKEGSTQNFKAFRITGSGTDQGTYWTFPVTPTAESGTIADSIDCALLFVEKGDIGDPGTTVPDISGLTQDTAPDPSNDLLPTYDTSAASTKSATFRDYIKALSGGAYPVFNVDYQPTPTAGANLANGTYDGFGITAVLPSGKIVIIYREGTTHVDDAGPENDFGVIRMRSSTDGGRTWTSPTTIKSTANEDLRNLGGGATPSGRLVLAYFRYNADTALAVNALMTSDDEGVTWSTPAEITVGVANSPYGGLIEIGDGKLALPMYGGYTGRLVISDDDFDTWGGTIDIGTGTPTESETSIVYLGGGTLVALSREEDVSGTVSFGQYKSTDNGLTWTSQGVTTFDTWSYASGHPPWLQRFRGPDGRLRVVCYYLDRDVTSVRAIYADAAELVASGVSAWDSTNAVTIATGLIAGGSGYPSVIHYRDNPAGVGWYYDETVTDDVTEIVTLVTPTTFPQSLGGPLAIGATQPDSRLHVQTDTQLASVPALGANSRDVQLFLSEPAGLYGLMAGVLNTGTGFLQAQRTDGVPSSYPLRLNPNGGAVEIGGALELGNAADTTLARSSAGNVTIEGNIIYRAGGTDVPLSDGGTGASLSDPGADRLMFWDDSAGTVEWLTLGTNLSITDTTLNASGGSGSGDVVGPASATDGGFAKFDGTTGKLIKNSAATIAVADGGTGRATGTTAYALIATGTTATGAQQSLAAGATTEVLVGGGSAALPVWTTATGSGAPVRATSPTLVTPNLGTPSAVVLTNATGLPQAGTVGLTTADSPQFAGLNIGHASDTTITRSGAGDIAVEGNAIYRAGGTDVPVTDGGTGSSTASGARTNLGAAASANAVFTGTMQQNDGAAVMYYYNTAGTVRTGYFQANSTDGFNIVMELNYPVRLYANNSNTINAAADGAVSFPRITTTASAANAFLDSGSTPANSILRSTSSSRYKKDIETLEQRYCDALLKMRPVWYRSIADADNKSWGWYGLIAEEVAKVDPRLVHWGYQDDQFEEIDVEHTSIVRDIVHDDVEQTYTEIVERDVEQTYTEIVERIDVRAVTQIATVALPDGPQQIEVQLKVPVRVAEEVQRTRIVKVPEEVQRTRVIQVARVVEREVKSTRKERRIRDGEQKRPDGVQYERLAVLLIGVVKAQDERLSALEGR